MTENTKHINRAVVLFSLSPNRESFRKKLYDEPAKNTEILKSLFNHTLKVLKASQEELDFDLIISSTGSVTYDGTTKITQEGSTFDERFKNTLSTVFSKSYDEVLIVGSDCLDISPELIVQSFRCFDKNDFVVGPSVDGGFYLLGVKNNDEKIYDNIHWYSGSVLKQLLFNIKNSGYSYSLLPQLNDIDSKNDLIEWVESCKTIHLQFCLYLKELITIYIIFLQINSIVYNAVKTYRRIYQRPPPAK